MHRLLSSRTIACSSFLQLPLLLAKGIAIGKTTAVKQMDPPDGVNLIAFDMKLRRTCSIFCLSAKMKAFCREESHFSSQRRPANFI